MTGFQASLFNTFSHRIVCLDSTHKTNHYRFKLLTLVVRDEYHNGRLNTIKKMHMHGLLFIIGMPVAWAISDREDADTIEAYWAAVKTKCPEAVVSNLMTDYG